jgi:uncharacterized protein YmfQ (DUF2313 family)
MPTPDLSEADFLAAYHALMPRGAAWSREPGTVLDAVLSAMADRAADMQARVVTLGDVESYPATATEILAEWERAYGLPDLCVGAGQTLQERRLALVSKIAAGGGQSRAYFIAVAAALGFTITIEEFRPFMFGQSTFGDPLLDVEAAFRWRVIAPEINTIFFRFGQSAFGEPFERASNTALECVLNRLKPAHTTLEFSYGS